MRMTQKKNDHSIYDLLLFSFPEFREEVYKDVKQDDLFVELSKEDKEQFEKIMFYIDTYPKPGPRPHVPVNLEFIFRKYLGD
jgi:hypothetical protein